MKLGDKLLHPLAIMSYLLIIVLVLVPLLPEESGFRLGVGYRIFFAVMIIAGGLFFLLLRREHLPMPTSRIGVLLSILVVSLITVGILTVSGIVYPYPQLPLPTPAPAIEEGEKVAKSKQLIEQGKELFFTTIGGISCALCHSYEGRGGERGPAMDDYAARAQKRIDEGIYPQVSLEEYTRKHIEEGSAYFLSDPKFAPIMPPMKNLLTKEQIEALVAFLLTTTGG